MQEASHLKLITMGLLQTSSYVTEQMQTRVTIDVNKFLGAFSIEVNGSRIHPPSWTTSEHNLNEIAPPMPILQASTSNSSILPGINFDMDDYRACRQKEAIRWINLQEKRSSIIARLQPTTVEEYQNLRDAVTLESGPLRRTVKKQPGMKCIYTKYFPSHILYLITATSRATQNQCNAMNDKALNLPKNPNLPKTPFDLLSRRQQHFY